MAEANAFLGRVKAWINFEIALREKHGHGAVHVFDRHAHHYVNGERLIGRPQ